MNTRIAIPAAIIIALLVAVSLCILYPELVFNSDGNTGLKERFSIRGQSFSRWRLIRSYNIISYGIFWTALLISSAYLLMRLISSTTKPIVLIDKYAIRAGFDALKRNPVTAAILLLYTALLYYGTTYYYVELIGWYSGVYTQDLLANFRLNEWFLRETMARNDYRFFPLAHQDLHLLSWFTPYVKVWILVSALQLFTIIYFSTKIIRRIAGKAVPYLFLSACLLFLFHASTAKAFFQFIYSERMIVFIFSIFVYSYYRYRETRQEQYFYACLITALWGVFFKDIAFVLFAGLPFFTVVFDLIKAAGVLRSESGFISSLSPLTEKYRLELAIVGIVLAYIFLYIMLSVFPSIAKGEGAYKDAAESFRLDIAPNDVRIWAIFLVLAFRSYRILAKKEQVEILDALNATAIAYILALASLVGFSSYSYLALPVYYVALLDILYMGVIVYNYASSRIKPNAAYLPGVVVCFALLFFHESKGGASFYSTLTYYKDVQSSWETTFNKVDEIAREKFATGDEVNIIYTKSWFNDGRHLDRLRYHRLIYLDPIDHNYVVKDGVNPGAHYKPKPGDIFINIDKDNLDFVENELQDLEMVYAYDEGRRNGRIYEFRTRAEK
ncbi:MAG: hypothetical protein WBG92_22280 [Thiohalocapsa sp.]